MCRPIKRHRNRKNRKTSFRAGNNIKNPTGKTKNSHRTQQAGWTNFNYFLLFHTFMNARKKKVDYRFGAIRVRISSVWEERKSCATCERKAFYRFFACGRTHESARIYSVFIISSRARNVHVNYASETVLFNGRLNTPILTKPVGRRVETKNVKIHRRESRNTVRGSGMEPTWRLHQIE